MADRGEPQEIAALRTNLTSITDTVTVGVNLQWFGNRLVEKRFICRREAQKLLDVSVTRPSMKAAQLMDSVFAVLETTDRKRGWFDQFVSIFSADKAHGELAAKLKSGVATASQQEGSQLSLIQAQRYELVRVLHVPKL